MPTMVYDELSAEENCCSLQVTGCSGSTSSRCRVVARSGTRWNGKIRWCELSPGQCPASGNCPSAVSRADLLLSMSRPLALTLRRPNGSPSICEKTSRTRCTILMSLHGESAMARTATRAVRLEAGTVVTDTRKRRNLSIRFFVCGRMNAYTLQRRGNFRKGSANRVRSRELLSSTIVLC